MDQPSSKKEMDLDDKATNALVASFHRAKSLIPADQKLITIPPEMPVSEALKFLLDKMEKYA